MPPRRKAATPSDDANLEEPSSSSSSSSSSGSSSRSSGRQHKQQQVVAIDDEEEEEEGKGGKNDDDDDDEDEGDKKKKRKKAPQEQTKVRAVRRRSGRNSRYDAGDDDDDDDDEGADNSSSSSTSRGAAFKGRKGAHQFKFEHQDDDEGFLKLVRLEAPKEKETNAFQSEPAEARKQCVKTIVRLFLTKGAQSEPVSKTSIIAALGKIDVAYKKHANAVILSAAQDVHAFFGYRVTTGAFLGPVGTGKKEDFYVVNRVQSSCLQEILAELNPSDAYMGFVFVVLQILNTAPGKKMDAEGILKNVRRIDDRFPDSVGKASSASSKSEAAAIPELGDSFAGLLARMQKEKYVLVGKDGSDDDIKKIYELGPRFYAEFGLRRLAKSYYQGMSQTLDDAVYGEAVKTVAELVKAARNDQDDEDDK